MFFGCFFHTSPSDPWDWSEVLAGQVGSGGFVFWVFFHTSPSDPWDWSEVLVGQVGSGQVVETSRVGSGRVRKVHMSRAGSALPARGDPTLVGWLFFFVPIT